MIWLGAYSYAWTLGHTSCPLALFVRCNFTCSGIWFYLPSEIHVCLYDVCCLLAERMEIAISQTCTVRLSWNLVKTSGWYPRLGCMFWFQDSIVFHIVKKKKKTHQNCKNHDFKKLEISPPFQVRLIWNLVGTSWQVLGKVRYVCFVCFIVLFFVYILST
jgi:hypothetical protein